jgi:50S ribosomal subunit-associated GTPase HflX
MKEHGSGVLMDTIGFISDLPHSLVDSFKATLDEIYMADILLHVRDISHPHTEHQKETVLKVLKEIGIEDDFLENNCIEVWNKTDLVEMSKGEDGFLDLI